METNRYNMKCKKNNKFKSYYVVWKRIKFRIKFPA